MTLRILACCWLLLLVGCPKQTTVTPPTATPSPYVRLVTYNAIISEANRAAAKAVRSASDAQLIPVETTRQIFAWQGRIASANKTLAIALSDGSVDVKSKAITDLVLQLAAPAVFDQWLQGLTSPEQQSLVSTLKALSATITLVVSEFAGSGHAELQFAPLKPTRANLGAWAAANETRVILDLPPVPGRLREFAYLERLEVLTWRQR